jgi:hypothetical protein
MNDYPIKMLPMQPSVLAPYLLPTFVLVLTMPVKERLSSIQPAPCTSNSRLVSTLMALAARKFIGMPTPMISTRPVPQAKKTKIAWSLTELLSAIRMVVTMHEANPYLDVMALN